VTPGRRGLVALAAVAAVAFAIAVHLALVQGLPPAMGALLCLVPLTGLALWGVKRARHRVLVLLAIAAVAGLSWRHWDLLVAHFPDVFFVEHVTANLVLASLFGRTLPAGREPLVTHLARIAHGGMTPRLARYTRGVTIAWTVFFLAVAATSALLYAADLRAAWSLLANGLTPVLVGAMFVVEYAIRHRVMPDLERIGVLGGFRAFSRYFAARAEAPR